MYVYANIYTASAHLNPPNLISVGVFKGGSPTCYLKQTTKYMGRKRVYEVVRHLPAEELDERTKKLEKDTRVLKRLYFIRHLYRGMSVEEAADLVGVIKATGYAWLKRWNSKGYEGLIPDFGGGRPPKLTKDQKEELREMLNKKDSWTTKEVQDLIKKEFGVSYSSWQVRRILKSFGMKYAKPFQKDYRRPENAEESLKRTSLRDGAPCYARAKLE